MPIRLSLICFGHKRRQDKWQLRHAILDTTLHLLLNETAHNQVPVEFGDHRVANVLVRIVVIVFVIVIVVICSSFTDALFSSSYHLAVYCLADNSDTLGTNWPQTQAGLTVSGSCGSGFYSVSAPQRHCSQPGSGSQGSWDAVINACTPVSCQASSTVGSTWLSTPGDSLGNGTCNSGFSPNGVLQRFCNQTGAIAQWENVINDCQGLFFELFSSF